MARERQVATRKGRATDTPPLPSHRIRRAEERALGPNALLPGVPWREVRRPAKDDHPRPGRHAGESPDRGRIRLVELADGEERGDLHLPEQPGPIVALERAGDGELAGP